MATPRLDKRRTLLFLIKDGQILLAMKKRGFGAGRWNGVGGKLEPHEAIEQALVRECQEEIGVTPTRYHQVAELDFHEFHDGKQIEAYVYVYFCDKWEGEPAESTEMAPQWFLLQDIPYNDMWADDVYWLPEILAGKRVLCTFRLDETDKVRSHSIDRDVTFNHKEEL